MLNSFHNPDILTCIANLSSDEVFTPPNVANQMLDTLPKEIWSDKTVTFLDPVSKSGVFLREITKRLVKGLENDFPDIEERIQHILKNQVFGLGITQLTSDISRRTLYCSKKANGEYSIVKFGDEEGNLKYIDSQHFWADGKKCAYCGVNKKLYQRNKGLESYAYSFIHEDKPEEAFNMKFDVIIGNPPYQMNDGGGMGASAMPIYQKFVEKAIKLSPTYISMIVPSRWFAGGRGLKDFRKKMLADKRMQEIHDFIDASDCFPGVEIKGGVNFFLWNKNFDGDCTVHTYESSQLKSKMKRPLMFEGTDVFIRYNDSIEIFKKIKSFEEKSFSQLVSGNDPFGFDIRVSPTDYRRVKPKYALKKSNESILFYYNNWSKEGIGYISEKEVNKNHHLINEIKILVPKAVGSGDASTDEIKPFIVESSSCCSETYLVIKCSSKKEAENICSYIKTKFFHFLVTLLKNTQGAYQKVYELVPQQNFDESWTDKKLYKKYGLSQNQIDYIENLVWPNED